MIVSMFRTAGSFLPVAHVSWNVYMYCKSFSSFLPHSLLELQCMCVLHDWRIAATGANAHADESKPKSC